MREGLERIFRSGPFSLSRAAAALSRSEIIPDASHDALITLREVSSTLLNDISRLAPFGVGNKKPIFLVRGACAVSLKRFGKEQNHVEVQFTCADTGYRTRAFDFFRSPEDFTHSPMPGTDVSVLATIERDTFRGGLALRLVDILPS